MMEEDGIDGPPRRLLLRSDPRSSSFGSRLSTAIRRSLRLGPKRSTTFGAGLTQSTSKERLKPDRLDVTEEEVPLTRIGNYFTEYADVKVEPCEKKYGSLTELKRLVQLARRNPIKKFLRYNDWPSGHEIRHELWKELCRDRNFEANRDLYLKELDELSHKGKSFGTLKARFLTAGGTVTHNFDLTEHGSVILQRLLIVVECVRPDVTYVPLLYPVCALMLHYMKEEDAFACAMRLLRSPGFLQQSSVSVTASARTLLALIKKHKSSVYSLLKKRAGVSTDSELIKVLAKWQSWIFRCLPINYAVRVIDCFLFEGHKMLLRVAVALVYIWSKNKARTGALFAGKTTDERIALLSSQLIDTAKNCPVSVQTLLDAAVGIRNLKGSTIARYQKFYEDAVREEEASKVELSEVVAGISPTRKISQYVYAKPFSSSIIDGSIANALMCAFPERLQFETPQLLFRLTDDGTSFTKFWAKIEEAEQTLLIIESSCSEVFGAYCSACWAERRDRRTKTRYFGTGESFVWKLDGEARVPIIFDWVGHTSEQPDQCPQYFLTADEKTIIIGGGGGDAISIRDELYKGLTSECSTFNNPALAAERDFVIRELEVFSVQSCPN